MRELLPPPPHLSHSQIRSLLPGRRHACALRSGLTRRLGYADPPSAPMALGSALDAGLNAMLRPRITGGEADILGAIAAMMQSLERDGPTVAPTNPAGWIREEGRWLQTALEAYYPLARALEVRAVQERLSFSFGGESVEGWIDRIDAGDVIVDHKLTATRPWDANGVWDAGWLAEPTAQLALYAAGLSILNGRPYRLGCLVVCYGSRRLKTPQWGALDVALTAEAQAQALEDVRTAAAIRDSGTYPPSPGTHCQWCPVAVPCRTVLALTAPSLADVAALL